MATVITSIGSKGTTGNAVAGPLTIITGGTGSGTPWTGTVKFSDSAESSKANVGDKLYFENVYHPGQFGSGCEGGGTANVVYLITGVSGDTLTVKYISGAYSTTSPYDIKSDSFCTTAAQPYVVRFYSTIDTWESGCDETTLYSSGDTAQGECYADSALSVSSPVEMSSGRTSDIAKQILTVPVGQRHDGTADSGFKINSTGGNAAIKLMVDTVQPMYRIVEWIEIDGGDSARTWGATNNPWAPIYMDAGGASGWEATASHNLVHGCHSNSNGNCYGMVGAKQAYSYIHNNIVYDCSGKWQTPGIGTKGIACNNTVYKIGMTDTGGGGGAATYREAIGVKSSSSDNVNKNNIAIGTYENSSTTGEKHDFFADGTGTVGTYNISGDSTASGSDSFTSITAASLFISTTSGSEDLHLVYNAVAIGAGADLGTAVSYGTDTAAGSSTYGTPLNRDINDGNRDSFSQTWDIGVSQYAIIAKIGANYPTGRDYSTFNAWEADLDDTSYYGKGSVANGQMYKDSDYQWNGHFYLTEGAGLAAATYLTVAEGQRHDGTPNTGVRFLNNGTYQYNGMVFQLHYVSGKPCKRSLEWVEMDENGKGGGGHTSALIHSAGGWGQISIGSFNHCMVYNYYLGNILAGDHAGVIHFNSQYGQAHNNLLFNIKAGNPSGGSPFLGNLFGITTDRTCVITNNTVYGLKHVDSTSGEAMGYKDSAYTTQEIYNNICVGNETQDFHDWDGATHSHNLSSDSSATGTGSVTGKSAASLFVSTTTGSEDLHLINGAAALGAGKDLGTKVTAWSADFGGEGTCMTHLNFDIDGENRNDEGDWDIGAAPLKPSSTGPAFLLFLDS